MAASVPLGARKPDNVQNSAPPNFFFGSQGSPNLLTANIQYLTFNGPAPPMTGSSPGPFGQSPQPLHRSAPSYGVQQQPMPSPMAMARPGPPPPSAMSRPGVPPQVSQQPVGFPLWRPTVPPSNQPPFGSRPSSTEPMPGGGSFPQHGGFPASSPPGSVSATPPSEARPNWFWFTSTYGTWHVHASL